MTTKQLEMLLRQHESRKSELLQELAAARAELELAQAEMIDAKEGAAERATAVQARVNAHEGAVAALARRIEQAERDLEASREGDRLSSAKEQMAEAAKESAAASAEIDQAFKDLQKAFEAAVEKVGAGGGRMDAARRMFSKLMRQVGGVHDAIEEMEAAGIDLTPVLSTLDHFEAQGHYRARRQPDLGRYAAQIRQAVTSALNSDRIEAARGAHKKPVAVADEPARA